MNYVKYIRALDITESMKSIDVIVKWEMRRLIKIKINIDKKK